MSLDGCSGLQRGGLGKYVASTAWQPFFLGVGPHLSLEDVTSLALTSRQWRDYTVFVAAAGPNMFATWMNNSCQERIHRLVMGKNPEERPVSRLLLLMGGCSEKGRVALWRFLRFPDHVESLAYACEKDTANAADAQERKAELTQVFQRTMKQCDAESPRNYRARLAKEVRIVRPPRFFLPLGCLLRALESTKVPVLRCSIPGEAGRVLESALLTATKRGSLPAVQMLCATTAAGGVPEGVLANALETAAELGKPKKLDFLLEEGLKRNLSFAYFSSAFVTAAGKGRVDVMRTLFQRCIVDSAGSGGVFPLGDAFIRAASEGRVVAMEELIYLSESAVVVRKQASITPLYWTKAVIAAAEAGQEDALQFLLDKGAKMITPSVIGDAFTAAIRELRENTAQILFPRLPVGHTMKLRRALKTRGADLEMNTVFERVVKACGEATMRASPACVFDV